MGFFGWSVEIRLRFVGQCGKAVWMKCFQQLLESNDLVYGGFSAGACVLSPSLRGIHLADKPENVPEGYPSEVIWEGIGLISFYIIPHFRSPHPGSEAMENVIAYYKKQKLPYHAIADGEVIVVDGESIEVVHR